MVGPVSDDLTAKAVEKAAQAMWEQVHGEGTWADRPFPPLAQMHRDAATVAVAAAVPIIREQVAREIEARVDEPRPSLLGFEHGMQRAARIARGGAS
jgi:hypothetical protein